MCAELPVLALGGVCQAAPLSPSSAKPRALSRPLRSHSMGPQATQPPPFALPAQPGVWTEEEDALLALWQGRVGNKWSEVRQAPDPPGWRSAVAASSKYPA